MPKEINPGSPLSSLAVGDHLIGGDGTDPSAYTQAAVWAAYNRDRYPMHTDGMLAEYRFDEGSGTTVNDIRNGNDIIFDAAALASPARDAPVWTRRGLTFSDTYIETPQLSGVRTIAILYKAPYQDPSGGFILGGFLNSSGSAISPGSAYNVQNGYVHHYANGQGVSPTLARPTTGQSFLRSNRGGWGLWFVEMATGGNSTFSLGGRSGFTTSRQDNCEIAWLGVWNDQLTDAERQTVYEGVRQVAAERDLYLDWRDPSQTVDCVILAGQSNAMGRSLISNLSAADQAVEFRNTFIQQGLAAVAASTYASPELLSLGVNQQWDDPANDFGPEFGIGLRREEADTTRVRPLYIAKSAVGSSALNIAGTPYNWSAAKDPVASLSHNCLANWWAMEQRLLGQGLGPRLRAVYWMQGENDATDQTFANEYEQELLDWVDYMQTYTGYGTDLQFVVGAHSRSRTVDDIRVNGAHGSRCCCHRALKCYDDRHG